MLASSKHRCSTLIVRSAIWTLWVCLIWEWDGNLLSIRRWDGNHLIEELGMLGACNIVIFKLLKSCSKIKIASRHDPNHSKSNSILTAQKPCLKHIFWSDFVPEKIYLKPFQNHCRACLQSINRIFSIASAFLSFLTSSS